MKNLHETLKTELHISKIEGTNLKEIWNTKINENEDLKCKIKLFAVQLDFLIYEYTALTSHFRKIDPCFVTKSVESILSKQMSEIKDDTELTLIKEISNLRETNHELLRRLIKREEIKLNRL